MRKFPEPIQIATAALNRLPGVGPKTALRYVYSFVKRPAKELETIAQAIKALAHLKVCEKCFTYSNDSICEYCSNPARDKRLLCVVSEPRDIATIESTGEYKGLYFVLGGALNPIDGQTVEMLRIKELEALLAKSEIISEIILAFSPNIHGETTILFLTKLLNNLNKKTSRLATGLPMGAELEYADEVTLMNAIKGRTKI